jgi:hypothetical protein
MCAAKFPLVSMGGRAEGLACADPALWTPIGACGNFTYDLFFIYQIKDLKKLPVLNLNNPSGKFLTSSLNLCMLQVILNVGTTQN